MIEISNQLSGIIEGHEKIPVGMAMIWDTTNTTPSNGFFVRYYSGLIPTGVALKRTQFEPNIMKDWGGGIPVELSQYINTYATNSGITLSDPYLISYSGHFNASDSGIYNFAARTNGIVSIYLDGAQILTGTVLASPGTYRGAQDLWSNRPYYWDDTVVLNTGWHSYKLDFKWPGVTSGDVSTPFLTAFYTSPGAQERVISSSVVNYEPRFLEPSVVAKTIYITESVDSELASQYSFEVSVSPSGQYNWNKAIEDFNTLKINRLCSIHMGYVTESGYYQTSGYTTNLTQCGDLVKKFTGLIDKVAVAQTKDSITATVSCRDFKKKLINAINENYPNRAHYTPSVLAKIDPSNQFDINHLMPTAFDAWNVFQTMETIAVAGGIDPIHLNKDKWDVQNHFVMESNLNWPLTTTVDINGLETKNGDPYIHQFVYGEPLNDALKKVSDLIGYNVYFDRFGDLVIKEPRRTNRIEVYETGNYGSRALSLSGNWTTSVDINASNRLYISPVGLSEASYSFSGVGFGIYETLFPAGAQYSVDIYNAQSQNVFSNIYSTQSGLTYGFLNSVTRDLNYGQYTAYIRPSGAIRIEGLEYYTQNIYKPVYTLKDNRDIITLNVDLDDYTLRNEVIAVGQQVSDKGYLYSKAIDLDSIGNPDAFNYTGEKRTFVLIEPTIQSQKRLDWLSSNILERFRRKQRNLSVVCQGLPQIEINDPVGVISNRLRMNSDTVSGYDINNSEIYYVNNISSRLAQGSYQTTFSLTSLKPIESWRPPLSVTTDVLRSIYAANNNSIFANFTQDTLNSNVGYGYDGFSEQASFVSFDLLLDVDRLWVLVADEKDGGAVFKNIDVNSKSPLITYQTANNQKADDPPKGAVWLHNGGGERWGHITIPNSNTQFNGGQWAGQNSESKVRLDGIYPIAIWAQFRTSDNSTVFQGIWVPTSGTLDNRNRTKAWSSTSEFNTYLSYNSDGSNTLVTPVNPTLKLSDLPGFVTKNSPMKINMWLGPISSGYQMVSDNLLVSMTGMFSHHGQYWNNSASALPTPANNNQNYYAGAGSQYGNFLYWKNSYTNITTTLPNGQFIQSVNGPWAVGDNIIRSGAAPGATEILNAIHDIYRVGSTKTLGDYKTIFGWTPQGIDYINIPATAYRDYVTHPRWIPSEGGNWISGAIESINHYANYITLRPNRDVYLKYTVYSPRTSTGGGGYPGTTYYYMSVAENTVTVGPFKSEIGIYLGPGENGFSMVNAWYIPELSDGPFWGTYSPRDSSAYYKFKGKQAIINDKNNISTEIAMVYSRSRGSYYQADALLHIFEITDAKTNEKYSFCMKTDVTKQFRPGNLSPISEVPQYPRNQRRPMLQTPAFGQNTSQGVKQYPRVL